MRRYVIPIFFSFALIFFFADCTSLTRTKPNQPYLGPFPDKFAALGHKNSLLVKEIGKLPEIQDGITASEAVALEVIAELYLKDTHRFEMAFTELYQEGYPEIRKYCSPLQAIFWLAENGVLDASLLDDFSLEKLLKKAWTEYGPHCLSKDEISEIILNLNFKKEFYLVKKEFDSDEEIQKWILDDFKKDKMVFNERAKAIIEQFLGRAMDWHSKHTKRWENFGIVTDRLHSPNLIAFYLKTHFKYSKDVSEGGWTPSPNLIFSMKRGNCSQHAAFATYCLRKAGYPAKTVLFAGFYIGDKGQAASEFKDKDGKLYVLDATLRGFRGINVITPKEDYVKILPEIRVLD